MWITATICHTISTWLWYGMTWMRNSTVVTTNRYNETSTPQMTMDLCHSVVFFVFILFPSCRFFPLTDTAVTERYYTSNTTGVQWIFPIVWYFLFLFYFLHVDLFLSPTVLLPNVTIWLTRRVSYKKQELGSFQVFLTGSLDFPF